MPTIMTLIDEYNYSFTYALITDFFKEYFEENLHLDLKCYSMIIHYTSTSNNVTSDFIHRITAGIIRTLSSSTVRSV